MTRLWRALDYAAGIAALLLIAKHGAGWAIAVCLVVSTAAMYQELRIKHDS